MAKAKPATVSTKPSKSAAAKKPAADKAAAEKAADQAAADAEKVAAEKAAADAEAEAAAEKAAAEKAAAEKAAAEKATADAEAEAAAEKAAADKATADQAAADAEAEAAIAEARDLQTPAQLAESFVGEDLAKAHDFAVSGKGAEAIALIDRKLDEVRQVQAATSHAAILLNNLRVAIGGDEAVGGLVKCFAVELVRHGGREYQIGEELHVPLKAYQRLLELRVVTDTDPAAPAPQAEDSAG